MEHLPNESYYPESIYPTSVRPAPVGSEGKYISLYLCFFANFVVYIHIKALNNSFQQLILLNQIYLMA